MEFWGVEVKPGESLKVEPGTEKYLHLSQASLGETKRVNESVALYVKFNDQKIVLGTLSGDKFPQVQFDLVFEKVFELSHSSKHTSIYVCGYRTQGDADEEDDEFDESDDESDEEAIPLDQAANGKFEVKNQQAKPSAGKPSIPKSDASTAKPKPKPEESKKNNKQKPEIDDIDNEDDSDDDDELDMDDDSDEEMVQGEDDSSDEDEDEDSDEDEETPVKAKSGDKRSAPAKKTPAPEKKAKLLSPAASQKSGDGGKKGVHTATPHPAKQGGKADKSKQQSPKSGGSIVCKSCSRTFNSEKSMQDHAKAKHSAAK